MCRHLPNVAEAACDTACHREIAGPSVTLNIAELAPGWQAARGRGTQPAAATPLSRRSCEKRLVSHWQRHMLPVQPLSCDHQSLSRVVLAYQW